MAGHGMNNCGKKKTSGRRQGLSTQGRAKPIPANVALNRELKKAKEAQKRRR
jgi:hypothetical protein